MADYTAAVLRVYGGEIASKWASLHLQSYQSWIFEAVGIRQDVIDRCFTNTVSRVGASSLEMAAAVERNHDAPAF